MIKLLDVKNMEAIVGGKDRNFSTAGVPARKTVKDAAKLLGFATVVKSSLNCYNDCYATIMKDGFNSENGLAGLKFAGMTAAVVAAHAKVEDMIDDAYDSFGWDA